MSRSMRDRVVEGSFKGIGAQEGQAFLHPIPAQTAVDDTLWCGMRFCPLDVVSDRSLRGRGRRER